MICRLLLLAALMLLAAAPARARLWETIDECEARYQPDPARRSKATTNGAEDRQWDVAGLGLRASFWRQRCEAIVFGTNFSNERLSPAVVRDLLQRNAAGGAWRQVGKDRWLLYRDKKAIAEAKFRAFLYRGNYRESLTLDTGAQRARWDAEYAREQAENRKARERF